MTSALAAARIGIDPSLSRGAPHRRPGRAMAVAAAVLALVGQLALGAPVGAEHSVPASVTETFTCTGGVQYFTVPQGVSSVHVVATGAPGGTPSSGGVGGDGARVEGDLAVTPGATLSVLVGCPASERFGGFNGGGTANTTQYGGHGAGGGGASDVRSTDALGDRLIIAAGGGGGGTTSAGTSPGAGGAGGDAGASGSNSGGSPTSLGGGAGSQTAGGAGGRAGGSDLNGARGNDGAAGGFAQGGAGGAPAFNNPGRGGGGGGGGLYGGGGGGGGGTGDSTSGGGGGGGGSSLVPSGGTLALAPAGSPPSVTIAYVPLPAQCHDGQDNDGDNLTDFPDDPGCTDENDDREMDPTSNDDFEDAEVLTGSSASATGSNVEATSQEGEPVHAGAGGGHSIWYRWTAPGSGSTTIELCGSDFDTVLAVYTGTAVDALIDVADNDDSSDDACGYLPSRVTFDATGGVTHHIAVDGYDGDTGNVSLSLTGPTGTSDTVPPTVTIEQAGGQADPTSDSPVAFTVAFSEPVSGFDAADVDLSASTAGGTLSAIVTDAGDQITYTVAVSGMSASGQVIASIPAGAASDTAGNPSEASTSTDNTVTFKAASPPGGPGTLSVVVSGPGGVLSDPSGIRCGSDCAEDYEAGTEVNLTAVARRGYTFSGWGGACASAGTVLTCTLVIDTDTEISATFGAAAPPPPSETATLSVEVTGGEHGGIRSDPAGIRCGTDCTQSYDVGTTVTLTAVVRRGQRFAGWGGACAFAGTEATCTVTIPADTEVTATFGP